MVVSCYVNDKKQIFAWMEQQPEVEKNIGKWNDSMKLDLILYTNTII